MFSIKTEVSRSGVEAVRFFSERITISGYHDSISKGSGSITFDSIGETDDGLFVNLPESPKIVDLMSVVQSPILYTFNGVEKISSGSELLTMMKIVYENALNNLYAPRA